MWRILAFMVLGSAAVGAAAEKVTLVAGGGDQPDGTLATQANVVQPFSVAFDKDGGILFVEFKGGERLRRINAAGRLSTLAGTGRQGAPGNDGPAVSATFNGMHDLAVAPDGRVYLADTFNHRIRVYNPQSKRIEPLAGTGEAGFAGDGGPATQAQFKQTICIDLTADGKTLYICDIGNRRVRAIDIPSGTIRTIAGNGKKGVPADGQPAIDQPLVDPRAVAVDAHGNLYVLERGGHALRVVGSDGRIRTVAGTGRKGSGGDGGPALKASFNGPKYLSCCKDGSVLITDTENHQIRRYLPGAERVELVAGTGRRGSGGLGGDPLKLQLARPHGAVEHPETGAIYIADSDNGRIVMIGE